MDAAYTGEKISTLRREKGLTQQELAELLHVTNKAVSKWERGRNYPDLALLQPLAAALDTTIAELLGVEQPITENAISVLSAISEQEKQSIRWSLFEYFFLVIAVSLYSVIRLYLLADRQLWWILMGNLYVLFSTLFLAGMLAKNFSEKSSFRWPKNGDAELFSEVKRLWGKKHR